MGASHSYTSNFFTITMIDRSTELLTIANEHDMYETKVSTDIQNNIARRKYNYKPYDLTDKQHDELEYYFFSSIFTKLPRRLIIDVDYVNVVCMVPSADAGMPHTRPGNIICIPYGVLPSFETIIHELWHIHQRKYPHIWNKFFNEQWYFKEWTTGRLPNSIDAQRRFNPDTIDSPLWIWKNEWVPVPIMTNITTPSLRDTDIWFFNIQSGSLLTDGNPPAEMKSFFSENINHIAYEHPKEMSAYMLSIPSFRHSEHTPGYNRLIREMGKI